MRRFLLIIISFYFTYCNAQVILSDNTNEDLIKMRVKQLDEFFQRFNNHIDSADHGYDAEMRCIISLCDYGMLHGKDEYAIQKQKDIITSFCGSIIDSAVSLHFEDETWFAQAEGMVKYKGKIEPITIFLRTDTISKEEKCWKICGCNADFLSLPAKSSNKGLIISPVDHELRFMSLSDITFGSNSQNIINQLHKEVSIDQLSVLAALIYTGELTIEYIEKVSYHFFQVPDYYFSVENFDRADTNSGWLISAINPMSAEQKEVFILNFLDSNKKSIHE